MSISRVDHAPRHTFGYIVRVQRDGYLYSKFFADGSSGGKRKARRLAEAFEADLIASLERSRKPRRDPAPGTRNRSGFVGVSRTTSDSGARRVDYWQAHWSDETGRRRSAKFSVERFGEEGAKRRAVRARRRGRAAALEA
jgi:hypothetical protein